jgi:ParB-like chromosome segregation protein Spo0J
MSSQIAIKDVEIVHLKLTYAHTRIQQQRQVVQMAESLNRYGQLLPIQVICADHPQYTLIDGYLRVAAARFCGLDTLLAQIMPGSEKEALAQLLTRNGARQFDIFEQAAMLQELQLRHQLSQVQIAAMLGKHTSWVNRRLAIMDTLPESAMAAVRSCALSSWAACRVLAPLARANAEHAEALCKAIARQPVSTRQLAEFLKHYKSANRRVRCQMIQDPQLFFKSLQAKTFEKDAMALKAGAEGRWCHDMRIVGHMLTRLCRLAADVFYVDQPELERRALMTAFADARQCWQKLITTIERLSHEKRTRSSGGAGDAQKRLQHPQNQSLDENVSQNRALHR